MNIRFKSIDIENFRSINKAKVELENQGTIIVRGINEYEDKATSNGSGKSSIFEAIVFALFEETSSGEKDVANRIINDGYCITLKFDVDNNSYVIIRNNIKNKSNVLFYKNDIDISARNKSDTNKMILNVLGISKSIFLDTVFLSQSVSTNLTTLSPTARKERLEILTNTDVSVNEFKDKLKEKQSAFEQVCEDNQLDIKKLEGQKETLHFQRNGIVTKIDEIQTQIDKRNALGNIEDIDKQIETSEKNINEIKDQIKSKEDQIVKQETEIEEFRKTGESNLDDKIQKQKELELKRIEYTGLQNQSSTITMELQNIQKEINRLENEIVKIKNSDTCPTCGRKYDNVNEEHIQKTIKDLQDQIDNQKTLLDEKTKSQNELLVKIKEKESEGIEFSKQVDDIDAKITEHRNQLSVLDLKRKTLITEKQDLQRRVEFIENGIKVLRDKKDQISKIEVGNKEEFENMLNEIDKQIEIVDKQIKTKLENQEVNNNYVTAIKHCLQLVTKDFRTYLLQNSIDYLNKLLERYSLSLFSNEKDKIYITNDDSKLDIMLGNATYESLSGGEKTRVNIALLLAQKSLANIIGNISCNIIILDEILGYCDSQAELNVIDLITQELESLESIYMISHKEIPIGYDMELTVIKDINGLSSVKGY